MSNILVAYFTASTGKVTEKVAKSWQLLQHQEAVVSERQQRS